MEWRRQQLDSTKLVSEKTPQDSIEGLVEQPAVGLEQVVHQPAPLRVAVEPLRHESQQERSYTAL